MMVRKGVYAAVSEKEMGWFDVHMGDAAEGVLASTEDGEGPIGAGGLMAKFTRETDDVRMATSLAAGTLLQHLTTVVTCLALAFTRSYSLTLVILAALPLLTLTQFLSQSHAAPLLAAERTHTARTATLIERALSSIATVKALNASSFEEDRAKGMFEGLRAKAKSLNGVWAVSGGVAQFVMMGMFVQGFWFGSKLVREGRVGAGDVMAVFWACLIAGSNLQMCIPQVITLAKGKFAMVALLSLIASSPPSSPPSPSSPTSPNSRKSHTLKKITPAKCTGELALHNITFTYPSRPSAPVLTNVSLFLPAHETTFVVGASGSGKSSVAALLLRMYQAGEGVVCLDEQDVRFLDEGWMRGVVGGVGQLGGAGVVILDGKSVYENVTMGMEGVTEEQVEEACRAAMMHEFVRDLPDGYETILGGGVGVGLSGGQKQRLALARARLRNPTVLILDEATSALDATSRILIFEALKRWRAHKTTVVITHDLSQIGPADFVYVLKAGRVVEQGYRSDLEAVPIEEDVGEFRKMMEAQRETGGYLPEKDTSVDLVEEREEALQREEEVEEDKGPNFKHQSIAIRPLTFGNWMFDVVADLTKSSSTPTVPAPVLLASSRDTQRISRYTPAPLSTLARRERRPSSIHLPSPLDIPASPSAAYTVARRRLSLQFTPTSTVFGARSTVAFNAESERWERGGREEGEEEREEREWEEEKRAVRHNGVLARAGRGERKIERKGWDVPLRDIKVSKSGAQDNANAPESDEDARPPFWPLMRTVYHTIPRKPLLLLGLATCLLSGALTPIFSYLLSRLLFEVSTGATNVRAINMFGGLVLGAAALDGFMMGLKYFLMESVAMEWVTSIRGIAFGRVLRQDKKWFDAGKGAEGLVQVLVKDGDDARDLVGVVWGQFFVVLAMVGVGLGWALVRGWQLTLAGFAIAPVFAGVMALQTGLVARCEVRNKRAREEVARGYYDAIINVRGIRCMAFDRVFKSRFDAAADKALTTGVRGALVEGCTYGVASGLIYLAEALLFYVGAVLIARGMYTYLQMVEVLNLVVFSVTIGSQLMAFTEKIAKSVQATGDFNKLMNLPTTTDESHGTLEPPLSGPITFTNVSFTYPSRPSAPVLKNINLTIHPSECIAIVGPSGSGKSTLAALLQRLYEPTSGVVSIGGTDVREMDVRWLREHVGVVSQSPNLFDASVSENIRYGSGSVSESDVRVAAKLAKAHEFVMELPEGYDTSLGENASLISGGQAQRLQIARALARPSPILILDECTSALDGENASGVLEAVWGAKGGRTTVVVTHKMEVMRGCDRIVVVEGGVVVEQGTWGELMERKGVFATLARGGEWIGE
ncbi:P-loop containing nucleoside triphosphate hydrolase protein [Crassisporium funariophilum]|nr:P-loop containing nucleoside triphosphate hydrolase protein [Crassisporium funariophilum]